MPQASPNVPTRRSRRIREKIEVSKCKAISLSKGSEIEATQLENLPAPGFKQNSQYIYQPLENPSAFLVKPKAITFTKEPNHEPDTRHELVEETQLKNVPAPGFKQNSQHIYQPLEKTSNCIRLASLERGVDDTIQCKLHTFPIDEAPPFIALSYTWGSPSSLRQIVLDGEGFAVRENLYLALIMLLQKKGQEYLFPPWFPYVPPNAQHSTSVRSKSSAFDLQPFSGSELDMMDRSSDTTAWKMFWIDALCIDQESVAERNHQVNMMRHIFTRAAFVTVWLGPENIDSRLAMDTLRSSYASQRSMSPRQVWADQVKRKAILSLLERDYWKRVWVIQEVMMASGILLLYGERELLWRELDSFMVELGPIHDRGSAFTIIEEKRMSQRKSLDYAILLHDLIPRYYRQACTDPRDRVFGLLGLIVEDLALNLRKTTIQADYSLSPSQLFDKVMDDTQNRVYLSPPSKSEFRFILKEALHLDQEEMTPEQKRDLCFYLSPTSKSDFRLILKEALHVKQGGEDSESFTPKQRRKRKLSSMIDENPDWETFISYDMA